LRVKEGKHFSGNIHFGFVAWYGKIPKIFTYFYFDYKTDWKKKFGENGISHR
jgi:hypothetical protein